MKKIYALIAVATAGVMSASAFTAFEGGKKEPHMLRSASEIVKAPNLKDAKTFTLNGFSRAEEVEVNAELINSFNQGICYLNANNWQDENGGDVEEFRNIQSCYETEIEATADLSKIYIKKYVGIDCVNDGIELVYNAETHKYDMELGQVFYVSQSYGNTALAIYNADTKKLEKTGKVSFTLYSNALVLDYDSWLYAVITVNGKDSYFSDITIADFRVFQPNATLSYAWTQPKDDAVKDINKDVLFEVSEPDPEDPNDLGGFLVSNVMPFEDGLVTYFDNVELKTGDVVIMYNGKPISASGYVDANTRTGDFYMAMLNESTSTYTNDVFAEYDLTTETFKWQSIPEIFAADYVGYDAWYTTSTNGYTYGQMTQATVAKKNGGISAVEAEAVEGPAEYYNLQGMKVANPAAGQIYIVKEGSKVSKRVF